MPGLGEIQVSVFRRWVNVLKNPSVLPGPGSGIFVERIFVEVFYAIGLGLWRKATAFLVMPLSLSASRHGLLYRYNDLVGCLVLHGIS